jgi:hypothetical protein
VIVDCKAETLCPFEATFFVCVGCMHMSIADIPQYISVWEASGRGGWVFVVPQLQ